MCNLLYLSKFSFSRDWKDLRNIRGAEIDLLEVENYRFEEDFLQIYLQRLPDDCKLWAIRYWTANNSGRNLPARFCGL
jgi:hypothetical protein